MNKQLFLRNSYLCAKMYAYLGGCISWGLRKKPTGYRVSFATLLIVMKGSY